MTLPRILTALQHQHTAQQLQYPARLPTAPLHPTQARQPAPFRHIQAHQQAQRQFTQSRAPQRCTQFPAPPQSTRLARPLRPTQCPRRRTHRTACALRLPLSFGAARRATAPTKSPTPRAQAAGAMPPLPELPRPTQAHPAIRPSQRLVLVPSWPALASVPSASLPVLLRFSSKGDAAWFDSLRH